MNYEEKYNEILEWARKNKARLNGVPIEEVLPELAESEDERITDTIFNCLYQCCDTGFISGTQRDNALAYLEKQAEEKFDLIDRNFRRGREVGYQEGVADTIAKQKENPKSSDSIPSDCTSDAKCEDRDSNYGVFPEDVIVVARACEKLEAHGYPELAHALKNVNLYTKEQTPVETPSPSVIYTEQGDVLAEQKPVENEKVEITDFEQSVYDLCPVLGIEEAKATASDLLELAKKQLLSYADESNPAIEAMADLERTYFNEPDKLPKWLKDDIAKKELNAHTKGYNMGYKDAEKQYNESVAYHFPIMPTPPSGWGCDGTHCTNPHGDCINCPRRFSSGGTITTPNTASGTSTATLHGNTSATDGKEHNPSFTD